MSKKKQWYPIDLEHADAYNKKQDKMQERMIVALEKIAIATEAQAAFYRRYNEPMGMLFKVLKA